MISKKKNRIIRKNLPKTKRSSSPNTFSASKTRLKSKRYTKKYLEKRDLYRRQILEKANAQLKSDLSEIQTKDQMLIENEIIFDESPDFKNKMNKTLTFIENPSYIPIRNERISARGGASPLKFFKSMEGEPIKSILRKY